MFYQECPMSSIFNELGYVLVTSAFDEDVHQSQSQPKILNFKRPAEPSQFEANRPLKQPKQQSNWSTCFSNQIGIVKPEEDTWSPPSTLAFPSESRPFVPKKASVTANRLVQSRDNILAERRRREKLNQRFVALSVLVPGLKKVNFFCMNFIPDSASGNCTCYMMHNPYG